MSAPVKPIPDGYVGATPYLCARDAAAALEFYKKAFGATETFRMADPSGKIGHAEFKIGQAAFMLADEYPEIKFLSPQTLGGSPMLIHLYVNDVDALVKQAVAAGATLDRAVENQFYGDRGGKLIDPFGHAWWLATHIEDVPPEEMKARAAKQHGSAD